MLSRLAPAKININLHITGRRDDGYHFLDSIMGFVDWGDHIILAPATRPALIVTGPQKHIFDDDLLSVEQSSPNLVIRALYAMADTVNQSPDFCITLDKHIPAGAGLGGGSSDAAAVMHLLNTYWGSPLSLDDLCAIGLGLGAELPVCLNGQSARVQGIGDVITSCSIPTYPLVIVWPDTPLNTGDVFKVYAASDAVLSNVIDINQPFANRNDLTDAATILCPDIPAIIETLRAQDGCRFAGMSGSGSACFGIFETIAQAHQATQIFDNAIAATIS